ncbi:MAG: hypothetical protein LBE86_03950 [Gemmobacter sp.]|jgi:hypothetical protein|nr:hypothetical protein [Gemmobacter sp.]
MREEKALPLYQVSALSEFMDRLDSLRETGAPQDGWDDIAIAAHRTKITTERATALTLLHKLPLRCRHDEVAGFRNFLIDPAILREAISLPEEGVVLPRMVARLLHLPAATITAHIAHGHLDRVTVKRPPPARPQVYVCPHSIDIFQDMFISQWDLVRQIEGRKNFVGSDNLLPEHRLDLGEKIEPIYRREVLDFL